MNVISAIPQHTRNLLIQQVSNWNEVPYPNTIVLKHSWHDCSSIVGDFMCDSYEFVPEDDVMLPNDDPSQHGISFLIYLKKYCIKWQEAKEWGLAEQHWQLTQDEEVPSLIVHHMKLKKLLIPKRKQKPCNATLKRKQKATSKRNKRKKAKVMLLCQEITLQLITALISGMCAISI